MGIREKIERLMMAVTFAEAGDDKSAREFLREEERPRARRRPQARQRPRLVLKTPSRRR